MEIITGHTGQPHVKSEQDCAWHRALFGEGSYILGTGNELRADVVSANEIRIRDGVLSHQGCFGIINHGSYDSLAIANGAQGVKRKDLIVCRYTKAGIEGMELVVIQGTPAASNPATPSHNSGTIANGDSPVDFPLYVVNIDGISVKSVESLADTISIKGTIEGFAQTISEMEQTITETLSDYIIRRAFNTGRHSAAEETGTISYNYTIAEADIPSGYKPIEVRLASNGGASGWYEYYNCYCDFADGTNNRTVNLKFQKRSGTGGTLYPWITVLFVKDI